MYESTNSKALDNDSLHGRSSDERQRGGLINYKEGICAQNAVAGSLAMIVP
jgi:hypothetical protein